MAFDIRLNNIFLQVRTERMRLNVQNGQPDLTSTQWAAAIGKEYGELCVAAMDTWRCGLTPTRKGYREELISLAAISIQAIEAYDLAEIRKEAGDNVAAQPECEGRQGI